MCFVLCIDYSLDMHDTAWPSAMWVKTQHIPGELVVICTIKPGYTATFELQLDFFLVQEQLKLLLLFFYSVSRHFGITLKSRVGPHVNELSL